MYCDRGDKKLLLVGHEDGSIQIFHHKKPDDADSSSWSLLANIKSQSKLIQCLALHHQFDEEGETAQFSNYLASASNEFTVHVFDLTSILENTGDTDHDNLVDNYILL